MAYFTPTQEWIRGLWSQNAQDGNAGQGLMGPAQLDMPPMGANMPIPEAQPQMEQPQPQESPIAKGLEAGMSAGRKSMEADAQQKERLAGLMLFHMFSGLSGGGGKNKSVLGGLGEGLRQGMPHLQNERANIEKLNLMEMERQAAIEKEMQRRKEHQENRTDLNNYRTGMLGLKQQILNAKNSTSGSQSINGMDVSSLPDLDKSSRTQYTKDFQQSGKALSELDSIKKKMKQLKKLENKNGSPWVSQANPYIASVTNPAKDFAGRNLPGKGAEQLNKERLLRQELGSEMEIFRVNMEKALKGGVLGPAMYDRFSESKAFPDLKNGYDTAETLLNNMHHEASLIHNSSSTGLRSGKLVTPLEYEEMNPRKPQIDESDPKIKKAREKGWSDKHIEMISQE